MPAGRPRGSKASKPPTVAGPKPATLPVVGVSRVDSLPIPQVACTACGQNIPFWNVEYISRTIKEGNKEPTDVICPKCRRIGFIDIAMLMSVGDLIRSYKQSQPPKPAVPKATKHKGIVERECPLCGEKGPTVWFRRHTSDGIRCNKLDKNFGNRKKVPWQTTTYKPRNRVVRDPVPAAEPPNAD